MEALCDELLATVGPPVVRVELVVGHGDPQDPFVWLGTATDSERDALSADADLPSVVRRVVERHGFASSGVTVESQETVDRNHDGSWFYRLR